MARRPRLAREGAAGHDDRVAVTGDASGAGHGDLAGGRAYRLLLRAIRAAWVSCAAGAVAMTLALALRSPALVTVFRVALVVTFMAIGLALLFFLRLVAFPAQPVDLLPGFRGASLRRRAEVLLTAVLIDLLDPE